MLDIVDFKKRLAQAAPSLPVVPVMNALIDHYRGPGTVYSPSILAAGGRLRGCSYAQVGEVLALLAFESLRLLEVHWSFWDPNKVQEMDQEIPISAEDVMNARLCNAFYHPETGELVDNFSLYLRHVYLSTPRMEALLRPNRVVELVLRCGAQEVSMPLGGEEKVKKDAQAVQKMVLDLMQQLEVRS